MMYDAGQCNVQAKALVGHRIKCLVLVLEVVIIGSTYPRDVMFNFENKGLL